MELWWLNDLWQVVAFEMCPIGKVHANQVPTSKSSSSIMGIDSVDILPTTMNRKSRKLIYSMTGGL
jgi:hypothetical protein